MTKETEERIAQLKAEIARLEKAGEWKPCLCWVSDEHENPSKWNSTLTAFVTERAAEPNSGRIYFVPGFRYYRYATPLTREEWLELEPEPKQGVAYIKPDSPLPSRYDWPAILKDHPEARWVSTDRNGRVDCWVGKPNAVESEGLWNSSGGILCILIRSSGLDIKDWRNSLEARPEGL